MKRKKKIILLLAFFSLFVSVYFIQDTYAKYLTMASTDVTGSIARWNIVVNDTVIKNNDQLENLITPTFSGTQHIASNVIAPTVTGSFELIIDSTDVDVSYSYNISIEQNDDVPDFKVTGYKVDDGNVVSVDTSVATPSITNNVLLSDTERIHTITVYIGWDDDPLTQSMDNAEDTDVTINLSDVTLTVDMTFTQLAS
jgi:hypothetical protein